MDPNPFPPQIDHNFPPPPDDDFSPEDVFKIFPTASHLGPDPPREPDVETTTSSNLDATTAYNISLGVNVTWFFGETEDKIILPLLLALIGICAVCGNLMVVLSVVVLKRMRTGPNLMLVNIAMSDLVFLSFTLPTAIVNHATPAGVSDSPMLCKFVHYIIFVCVYVTIYTLVVTCVFRFCTDCTGPHPGSSLLSRSNAIVSCFVIWVAFIMSHLNFLVQEDGAIFQEPFICVHSTLLADHTKIQTLWITFLTCAFLLPLLTVLALCAATLRYQQGGHKHRNYESAQNDMNEKQNHREVTMVIMAVMVARVICWLPIQVFVMMDIFGVTDMSEMYAKAEMLAVCIAFLGSAINPLVYNCVSSSFKQAFGEVLSRCCCRGGTRGIPEPPHKPNSDASGSDMNETIMSIISDSSNHINYC